MIQEEQRIVETTISDFLPAVAARKNEGCRLVAITATTNGDRCELCYSFDKFYRILTHRIVLHTGDTLSSITGMYPSAFVYENELRDIYGIAIAARQAASKDTRPRKRFTYPIELGIKTGDTLCRTR